MGLVTSTIASRLAFFPPDPPTYCVVKDETSGGLLLERNAAAGANGAGFAAPIGGGDGGPVAIRKLTTKRKQKIVAMFIRHPKAKFSILYSHGNAADLGQMCDLFIELAATLRCNLLGYDYSGYGASSGKPSEQNTYADIEAAYQCLTEEFKIREDDVILYGQSVGSGPTCDLAAKIPRLRGVVLHSPILSGVRVLYDVKTSYFFDIFKNIDKVEKIKCPLLVVHGTSDEVVHVSHGRELHKLAPRAYEPLWVDGGRHCDLETYPAYLSHLRKFIHHLEQNPPPPPTS